MTRVHLLMERQGTVAGITSTYTANSLRQNCFRGLRG